MPNAGVTPDLPAPTYFPAPTVLVTGCNTGIGLELARLFLTPVEVFTGVSGSCECSTSVNPKVRQVVLSGFVEIYSGS